ncbi:MAG: PDZ domain-containing protein [Planctomycetota bacterium]|nr:MAG: PDZ domain-containing protein [Planctomycetota bacterium]
MLVPSKRAGVSAAVWILMLTVACTEPGGPSHSQEPVPPPADPAALEALPAAAAPLAATPPRPPRVLTPPEAARRDRLRSSVAWLASPEREGRGPGTAGIDQAGAWLAEQFVALGLDTTVVGEEPFQSFPMTLDAQLGAADENALQLVAPPAGDGTAAVQTLVLGTDYTPLAAGGSGEFDLPLVFAGYGITATTEQYDDFAPLQGDGAKGAAVVILRQEPQKDDPQSKFDGNQTSQYAALSRKVANASEHEVGGVVFCNDASNTEDALMAFTRAGSGADKRTLPVIQLKRSRVDAIVEQTLGKRLADLEKAIDDGPTPQSAPLSGWRIRGKVSIDRSETVARNVLAILPGVGADAPAVGSDPSAVGNAGPHGEATEAPADPHATVTVEAAGPPDDAAGPHRLAAPAVAILPAETVILGAHYDHLGYGGSNSAAPGDSSVHHGADDNASGTAMLVEVARMLAEEGPYPRTILFAAFSGEERGLLGSAHYTSNAPVPLDDTVAMVNLDMVGRLDGEKLIIHGTGTGSLLDGMIDRLGARYGFLVTKDPGGFGPSDHASFYAKKVPVLHIFTGTHTDYHRPTDTAEKINYDGMARVARLVVEAVKELANAPLRPEYIEVASKPMARRDGDRPYFGSIPDFANPGKGYAISGVSKDSPAAQGGLQPGDLIVRLGESAVTGLDDFDSALRKHKGGDTVPVVVKRGGQDVALSVTLGAPK